ncbi:MAG: hypothetical protein KDA57_09475 [Planctomycetales bacterium]|nr:hypothetical protein [Planctomycetales bacterium]
MSDKKKIEKELCDWTQTDLRLHFEQLRAVVTNPTHVCSKCGRSANRKKWLCRAKKL